MATVAEVLGLLMAGLDYPPRHILSESDALLFVYQAFSLSAQKLASVDRSVRSLFFTRTPSAREFTLADEVGFSMAGYVERLVDESRLKYDPVIIADIDQINTYEEAGEFAIAFYNVPGPLAGARISWDPSEVSQNTLRIWHAPDSIAPATMQDTVALPANFTFMLAGQAAALAAPKVLRRAAKAGDASYLEFVRAWIEVNRPFLVDFDAQFEMFRSATRDDTAGANMAFGARRRAGGQNQWRRYGG